MRVEIKFKEKKYFDKCSEFLNVITKNEEEKILIIYVFDEWLFNQIILPLDKLYEFYKILE